MAIDSENKAVEPGLDLEKQDMGEQSNEKGGLSLRMLVAVGVFAVYSYLVMNEGAVRAQGNADPMPAPFSMELLLASAVGEMWFGLFGFLLAAALALYGFGSKMITTIWMITAFVLGWFVFIVFVLAVPIFNLVQNREVPEGLGLTLGEYDTFRVMGLLGGMVWCFALQGGQFMVGNLIKAHQSQGKTKGAGYAKARMIMWSVNMCISGIVFLIGGAVVRSSLGPGPYPAPVVSEPILIIYPELTITAGVLQFLFGVVAVMGAFAGGMFTPIAIFGTFSWLVTLSTIVWGQAFLIGTPVGTTLLAGLSLVTFGNVLFSASEYQKDLKIE